MIYHEVRSEQEVWKAVRDYMMTPLENFHNNNNNEEFLSWWNNQEPQPPTSSTNPQQQLTLSPHIPSIPQVFIPDPDMIEDTQQPTYLKQDSRANLTEENNNLIDELIKDFN